MSKTAVAGEIRDVDFAAALGDRYLSYALSTITARSLPDVRDGLKPVHRRILHAMRELKLDPKSGFKKCARVVGDVIGKFHPHGDAAVYDALVRLAQDFAQRYPLVEGQGNFGNIDGDNAAHYRYTESRLTDVAEALLAGIDQDAVDFRLTYDGENSEPVVLPARFPNLLANGATGIAVGMATSIPPHNVGELCDALSYLVKHKRATVEELAERVPGPDFPTGGVLVEAPDAIRQAYATGRGSFRLRARWEVEKLSHGLYQMIVTEIPYQVPKSRLIEKIAEPARGAEAAAAGRYPRRIDGYGAARHRAQDAERRSRRADGVALPRERARDPRHAQHECARRARRAPRHEPQGGAASLPRPSPRGAAARDALPACRDRAAAARSSRARSSSILISTRSSASSARRTIPRRA